MFQICFKIHKSEMTTINEIILTEFSTPDPYRLHYVAQYRFVHQYAEFLIRRDENGNIVPGLAENWVISEDRHKITFTLRPNLYTAKEVKESLVRLLKAKQTAHSNFIQQTTEDKIRILSENQLEIETHGDAGGLLSPLYMADAAILPNNHWIKNTDGIEIVDWTKVKGPYIWKSGKFPIHNGESIELIPNNKHYMFNKEQLNWRITYMPLEELANYESLNQEFKNNLSYTTIRYWPYWKINNNWSADSSSFYETKPNGIAFIMPNLRSPFFKDRENRRKLFKLRLLAQIHNISENLLAHQIAQPGMRGVITEKEVEKIISSIKAENISNEFLNHPLTWCLPNENIVNKEWIVQLVKSLGLKKVHFEYGIANPWHEKWKKGECDLMFGAVGMSDTDPLSGASFLFSPQGANQDSENANALKIINSVKKESDPKEITHALQIAFTKALLEALVVPIHYTVNRHIYSKKLNLNISDPFAESIFAHKIRTSPVM
jgi:ABC-type transport system substrate-binding protein